MKNYVSSTHLSVTTDTDTTYVEFPKNTLAPNSIKYVPDDDYYTCSVWCAVPTIGWGYIKQDFSATLYNSNIRSVRFLGQSYKSGVTVFGWNPIRTWYTKPNASSLEINMKGSLNFIFKGVELGGAQTFLWTGHGSGNRIVD